MTLTDTGPPSRLPPALTWLVYLGVVAGIYGAGVRLWDGFYNGGDFKVEADWGKEFDYYGLLRGWLGGGPPPYHVSLPELAEPYQETDRFLGLPETNLSPQVLLLPYVATGRFLLLNTVLLYTLGFAGCLLICRRYRLGVVPSALLLIVFSFNGFITAHLSAGHSMFNGYFLLSFVCLYVLELLEGGSDRTALKLAAVLFVMMLQGSFHIVIWCWMLIFLLAVLHRRYLRPGLLALAFSVGLSFFRLAPAAVTFWGATGRRFYTGYPTLGEMLEGLTVLRPNTEDWYPPDSWGVREQLHWSEFDMYVGPFALGALLYFGVYLRFRDDPRLARWRYADLDVPLLVLFFFSLNYFYRPIANSGVPLLNVEGVTTRFLILPLLFLLCLAAIRMQRVLESARPGLAVHVLLAGGTLQTFFALATHASVLRIPAAPEGASYLGRAFVVERPDGWYVFSVRASVVVSLAALAAWGYAFWRSRAPSPAKP
jgi:hypothetical protein